MLDQLTQLRSSKAGRCSSWNRKGRNRDVWFFEPGESRVIADIKGPGAITHIWMTQTLNYRETLLKFTWDNAKYPSIECPLGDFFGLGHSIVNSYDSLFFNASTRFNNQFNKPCALNCYLKMPFNERVVVEVVNQSKEEYRQFFYIDYETYEEELGESTGYLHAEFRRENPFGGWAPEIPGSQPESHIVNTKRTAWDNNYVILETKGRGHYIGCNMSITNFEGGWWGEGDDMIWVDGYKWPPDIHGTGSEDYLNQAFGMQSNAFLRNGSSIYEHDTGGYQTSYVFHAENAIPFTKEVKVTIEHGHGNHLGNEVSSVAYWYADKPYRVAKVPPVNKRMPVLKDNQGNWIFDKKNQTTSRKIELNAEMKKFKAQYARERAREKKRREISGK
ncbi:glycoside hydrolase family 172 protein [Candidatus Hydrogenedentota bacterium]